MKFVQIVQFQSSKIDEVGKLGDAYEAEIGSDNKARRALLTEDRDNPGTYLQIIFFDSYEEAMANSNHPATQKIAEGMGKLADGAPTFYNLDVIEDRQL
jgi:hypothetical protein